MSAWEKGRRPVRMTPGQIQAYQGVSTFLTLAQLRAKMREVPNIGHLAAEMEVPDTVARGPVSEDGHIRLDETTPAQLRGYVVAIHPRQSPAGA